MSWFDWATGWIKWDSAMERSHERRLSILEGKVQIMGDVLDDIELKFETYQALVNSTLADLKAKIQVLTAGQLDPAKAQAIEDEIDAAAAALAPPA